MEIKKCDSPISGTIPNTTICYRSNSLWPIESPDAPQPVDIPLRYSLHFLQKIQFFAWHSLGNNGTYS
jgi:hypothetical protein